MNERVEKFVATLPEKVQIREVGPREGFQRGTIIPTDVKVQVINKLVDSGIKKIQVCSMVHPKYVPQWADADQVLEQINYVPGVTYAALTLNEKGVDRVIEARAKGSGLNEVIFLWGCTDQVLQANGINKTVEEMGKDLEHLVKKCKEEGLLVVISVSAAFGCSQAGWVHPDKPIELVKWVMDMGADEAHIGDSTGQASPLQILNLFSRLENEVPPFNYAVHFHNNRGAAIANTLALVQQNYENLDLTYDTSFGEVGGCPFIGAAGNLSTEDLVCFFESMGVKTGINVEKVIEASRIAKEYYTAEEGAIVSHSVNCGTPDWWKEVSPHEYFNYIK